MLCYSYFSPHAQGKENSPQNRPRRSRWGVEVYRYFFFNFGARWGGRSTPRPGRFTPGERPGTRCTGGWVGHSASLDGCGKSRSQLGFDPRTVQTVRVTIPTEISRPTHKYKWSRNWQEQKFQNYRCQNFKIGIGNSKDTFPCKR